MREHLNNHWPKYLVAAVFGGAILFTGIIAPFGNNGVSSGKAPHIDAISPNPGYPGVMATMSGSGFTKQSDNITETRVDGQKLAPGNYIKVLGQLQQSHAFSQDGATLQIRFDLNTSRVVQECAKRTDQNKPCDVGIKVVNGYGVESNEFHYLVTNKLPPLHASYEVIPLNPANPAQDIMVHISDTLSGKSTEVFRYRIAADSKNDTNINVWATVPYAHSSDGKPMDCSKIFEYSAVAIIDSLTNSGDTSIFWGGLNPDSLGWCASSGGGTFTIAPGEQKTFSLKMAANTMAPVGLRFRLSSANELSAAPYFGIGNGDRDVLISNNTGADWLGGAGEWSSFITMAP